MPGMSDPSREALYLAQDLQQRMMRWIARRGASARVIVTPFVDPAGRPNVLIRLNAHVARAMILSFDQQHAQPPQWPPSRS
ncbi:MAG: hypothetical protein ACJ72W_08310 [Actinoallomurus sp.]